MHLPFRATVMKDSSAAARPYRCPDLPSAPVDAVRAELAGALEHGNAVLSAPPGAGKSSRVPLWLLEAPWLAGRKRSISPSPSKSAQVMETLLLIAPLPAPLKKVLVVFCPQTNVPFP